VEPQLKSGDLIRVLDDWCRPFPGFFLLLPEPKTATGGTIRADRHIEGGRNRRPRRCRSRLCIAS
jgi:hypothetical protein